MGKNPIPSQFHDPMKTANPRLTINDVEKFKKRILEHSGSYRAFARNSGACSEATIRRAIKSGYLSLEMAKKISQHLGITIYELLECECEKPKLVVAKNEPDGYANPFLGFVNELTEALRDVFDILGFEDEGGKKKKKKGKKKKGKKGKRK